jgi:hypothetical protein
LDSISHPSNSYTSSKPLRQTRLRPQAVDSSNPRKSMGQFLNPGIAKRFSQLAMFLVGNMSYLLILLLIISLALGCPPRSTMLTSFVRTTWLPQSSNIVRRFTLSLVTFTTTAFAFETIPTCPLLIFHSHLQCSTASKVTLTGLAPSHILEPYVPPGHLRERIL